MMTADDLYSVFREKRVMRETGTTLLVVDSDVHARYLNGDLIAKERRLCPGDLLKCLNALDGHVGCGNHDNCDSCRLRSMVGQSLARRERMSGEVSLLLEGNTEYDARVTCTPFTHERSLYAVVVLVDSTVKHRELMLERIFFHDMLNLSGAIKGLLDHIGDGPDGEALAVARDLATQMVDGMVAQRDLIYAQKGALRCAVTTCRVSDILAFAQESLAPMAEAAGKSLRLSDSAGGEELRTDARLVHRVLLNMVKNALEATPRGGEVTLSARAGEEGVVLSVHNEGAVDKRVRADIFKYGNTTKGDGRGLGTYSIKLIGENYLRGRVWFTTGKREGTDFHLALPLRGE